MNITTMPIRLRSSTKQDLSLITRCSFILFCFVEFRSSVSITILDLPDADYDAIGLSSSPEAAASLKGLGAEERELLGHVPAPSPGPSTAAAIQTG